MSVYDIFLFAGGLGLLIYGIRALAGGLEGAAGERLKYFLRKVARGKVSGVLTGTVFAAAVQSSNAVTLAAVGFTDAGIMELEQAIGVIIGANIGTTIAAQLLAFNITDIAPLLIFAGVIMMYFVKNPAVRKTGAAVTGFGIIFIGLALMTQAIKPLAGADWMIKLTGALEKYPVLAVLEGTLLSAVMQSSLAAFGVIQTAALWGLLNLKNGVFLILGINIGTCLTAIIGGMGLSAQAKKAALSNLIYNFLGAIIFFAAITVVPGSLSVLSNISPVDTLRQLANFHTIFNIVSALLFMWFPGLLIKSSELFIRQRTSEAQKRFRREYKRNVRSYRAPPFQRRGG